MSETAAISRSDADLLGEASAAYRRLQEAIARRIVGQQRTVRELITAVLCEGHVLVVGVPGLGKTLLVRTLADALGWEFKRIQFTPDMMPADITGMELLQEDPSTGQRSWRFCPGPIFANIVLADEVNRTPPKTQAALLEAMEEQTVTSMGRTYPLRRPFVVVATQNPIEQEGTYPLPEAQLDRFMFSLWMDYPSPEEEQTIAAGAGGSEASLEPVLTADRAEQFRELVRRVPVAASVVRAAVDLVRATRPGDPLADDFVRSYVEWGAGPRASQSLVLAGQALAVLDGEPTVSTDHVREAATLVLRHRVLPNYAATGEGVAADRIVQHVRERAGAPR